MLNSCYLAAVLMELESPVTAVAGEPVTLGCELFGYGGTQEIIWRFDNEHIENDSVFTITVAEGNRFLQTGGDTPGPSMVSFLTINNPTTCHSGQYICSSDPGVVLMTSMTLTVIPSTCSTGKCRQL